MRVIVLEFLDTDVFQVSSESCVVFLDPLVESWDIDLASLRLRISLNANLVADPRRSFAFLECDPGDNPDPEPGLAEFLKDPQLSAGVTEGEIQYLRAHRFGGRRPTKLYYYRALQSLKDPLHFRRD
jgi:hypothetical protein